MAIDSTMMICLHCYAGGHDKFYNIWIEKRQAKYYLMFAYGRATRDTAQDATSKGIYDSFHAAKYGADELAQEKERRGYVNVLAPAYAGGRSFQELQGKVLTYHAVPLEERRFGQRTPPNVRRPPPPPVPERIDPPPTQSPPGPPRPRSTLPEPGHALTRSRRTLE
jgi:predicted DNA-binding WGR domain protein